MYFSPNLTLGIRTKDLHSIVRSRRPVVVPIECPDQKPWLPLPLPKMKVLEPPLQGFNASSCPQWRQAHLVLDVDVSSSINQLTYDAHVAVGDSVKHCMVQSRPTVLSPHTCIRKGTTTKEELFSRISNKQKLCGLRWRCGGVPAPKNTPSRARQIDCDAIASATEL